MLLTFKWSRLLITLASFCLLAACVSPPLPAVNFTEDMLRKDGKAVVVFGVQLSDHVKIFEGCALIVTLATIDGSGIPTKAWTVGNFPNGVYLLQTEVKAGTYGVHSVTCQIGNSRYIYNPPAGRVFTTFTVAAGEVVDLGTASINFWHKGEASLFASFQNVALVFVDPLPEDSRRKVRADIASKLTLRHMKPVSVPPEAQIVEACRNQRLRRANAIAAAFSSSTDAPICKRAPSHTRAPA